ncbi:hypothetical protein [uncultured Microscilla sp.]|uniref:ISAzo13-like element transposase-related protein n=1 Tax=uncultured Microscilla sp. TaxID=432653 RepID=UPI002601A9B9|nr:hypothetical protein [uncultured Microscilla sp.]
MKTGTIKKVENRDEQFQNISSLITTYQASGHPVLSMDTKKKEWVGPFYQEGKVYTQKEAPQAFDHDSNSLAEGQVIPHGIYDIGRNEAYMYLGTSRDTAEFALVP